MLRPKLSKVTPNDDFTLLLEYENEEKKIFDVKPYFDFKPFVELKNIVLFKTVKVAGLSIEWLHGQDICPDDLYYNSVSVV
ncbi:MAG: DUF2442 domain-containing protein [Oscillospiraceae bacterium]|nr:DUF2442 domain-containing protein [Oscillospiraceae bacterium]